MELRQLEYFLAVTRCKNYTKAANLLHVSQPTISVAIQKLEEEMGVRLLERDNKNLSLTREGELFQAEGEKILAAAEGLGKLMNDLRPAVKKHLKVAFPSTIGSWLWRVLLFRFPTVHPDIELEIADYGTLEIVQLLKEQEIEIGYGVIGMVEDGAIDYEVLRQGEMQLIVPVSHPFAQLQAVAVEKLADQHIIMYDKGTTYVERLLLEQLEKAGLRPSFRYVREQSSVFDMVAQDCGIAVALDGKVSMIRDNSRLAAVPLEPPVAFATGLLWHKNKFLSSSARKFKDFLSSYREVGG